MQSESFHAQWARLKARLDLRELLRVRHQPGLRPAHLQEPEVLPREVWRPRHHQLSAQEECLRHSDRDPELALALQAQRRDRHRRHHRHRDRYPSGRDHDRLPEFQNSQ